MPESFVSVYVLGAIIAAIIIAMSVVFLVKAARRAKAIGMDKKIVTETIKNSALFSIIPSIPIEGIIENKALFYCFLNNFFNV